MRIGFITRRDAFEHRGGDTVQLERIAQHLRARGHSVDVHVGLDIPPQPGWDIVHVFNLQRPGETYEQVRRSARIAPVVLSPIFGDTTSLDQHGRSLVRRVLHRALPDRLIEAGKQGRRVRAGVADSATIWPVLRFRPARLRAQVLAACSGIYPNSRWEAEGLLPLLPTEQAGKMSVVPNGVELSLLDHGQQGAEFRRRFGVEDERFVLCVARFDERKNNLALVRAAQLAGVPCVLIGRPAPLHYRYFERCQAEARRSTNIRILTEQFSQEALIGAYRAAHVHALPSWLETPGLVSLEAGLCGANLVVGDCPPVREYFRDAAWYVDPSDTASIAKALNEAMAAPRDARGGADRIAREYSWDRVAEAQETQYRVVLSREVEPVSAATSGGSL